MLRLGGQRCASCGTRSTPSLTEMWCCSFCKKSPDVHDDACDALFASRQLPPGPLQFAMSHLAQIGLLMEITVEAKQPLEEFSDHQLKALAKSVGCNFVRPSGATKIVSSEGRFTVPCFGNERVGCYLCSTKVYEQRDLVCTPIQQETHAGASRGKAIAQLTRHHKT